MVKIRKLASIEKGLEEIIKVLSEEEIKQAINKGGSYIRKCSDPDPDSDGIKRCKIFLDETIIKTIPVRKKPFQGWRYLKKNRTPADITDPLTTTFDDDIPLKVQQQLLEVGLL